MEFFNFTKYAADSCIITDKVGLETLLVVSKATFAIGSNSVLELREQQNEVLMADEFYGEPDCSSIKFESDLALNKPALDIVLVGHAWSKNNSNFVDVLLRFQKRSKTVRVFGNRYWRKGLFGYSISKPEPFEKIPLKYELAFGGVDDSVDGKPAESEPFNPVGCGFRVKKSKKEIAGCLLPNIEDPKMLIKNPSHKPDPVGFGFVNRGWFPRKELAGTYDDEWQKNRMPLLPYDFDDSYYNSASNGFVIDGQVNGGEEVELYNGSKSGYIKCILPEIKLEAVLSIEYGYETKNIKFDTVIIDTDKETVSLVGRSSFNVQNRIYDMKFAKVQNVSKEE